MEEKKKKRKTRKYARLPLNSNRKTICNDNKLDNLSIYGGLTEHYSKEIKKQALYATQNRPHTYTNSENT
jgi:hypothetical protein